MMTFEEFDKYARALHDVHPGWRRGQALYNALCRARPDLADRITYKPALDPFYRDDVLPACLQFVREEWWRNDPVSR